MGSEYSLAKGAAKGAEVAGAGVAATTVVMSVLQLLTILYPESALAQPEVLDAAREAVLATGAAVTAGATAFRMWNNRRKQVKKAKTYASGLPMVLLLCGAVALMGPGCQSLQNLTPEQIDAIGCATQNGLEFWTAWEAAQEAQDEAQEAADKKEKALAVSVGVGVASYAYERQQGVGQPEAFANAAMTARQFCLMTYGEDLDVLAGAIARGEHRPEELSDADILLGLLRARLLLPPGDVIDPITIP